MPSCSERSITFDTHEDGKNDGSHVHVFVKNRLNNSLSPEQSTDFIVELARLSRGTRLSETSATATAIPISLPRLFQGHGDTYDEGSSQTIDLDLASRHRRRQRRRPPSSRHPHAGARERPVDLRLHRHADLRQRRVQFQSRCRRVPGIVLDQDNRNHSGFGVENPLRTLPIPAPTTAATNAILKKVVLEFSTHNDDKNATRS